MIDSDKLYKIAAANIANPYADIIPFALQVGYPIIYYRGVALQKDEVILYVLPANVYDDKEKVVGYTGSSAGVSVRVAKGVSVRTGANKGRPVRGNVREYASGDLVITNKRLIFVAQKKGFDISVSKITAAKILDKQSFMVQTGSVAKNIIVDEALTAYALALIDHAVSSYTNGKDLYNGYQLVQNNMTVEQKQMCADVKKSAESVKIKKKRAKKGGCLIPVLCVIAIFAVCVVVGITSSSKNKEKEQPEESVQLSARTDEELILLENHPRICDELSVAKEFVDGLCDDRVCIVYTEAGKTATIDEEEPYEDAVVTYHRDASTNKHIGWFEIEIKDSEFATNMTVEQAVEIAMSYLPENFKEIYQCDESYIRDGEKSIVYTYAMRLHPAGIEFHNNGNQHYPNYLSFYIVDYTEENKWTIKCDFSANGGKGIGWIEKYAEPWNITIIEE